jgi:hypothetical protein
MKHTLFAKQTMTTRHCEQNEVLRGNPIIICYLLPANFPLLFPFIFITLDDESTGMWLRGLEKPSEKRCANKSRIDPPDKKIGAHCAFYFCHDSPTWSGSRRPYVESRRDHSFQ